MLFRTCPALLRSLKDSYFKHIFLLDQTIFPPVLHARFPTDFGFYASGKTTEFSILGWKSFLFSNSLPLKKEWFRLLFWLEAMPAVISLKAKPRKSSYLCRETFSMYLLAGEVLLTHEEKLKWLLKMAVMQMVRRVRGARIVGRCSGSFECDIWKECF